MNIVLDGTNMLDEVITVAYGTAKRSSFTGSASVLDASEIEQVQVTNPVDALKGKVSGVQINSNSGAPGNSSPSVLIRGISSINAGTSPSSSLTVLHTTEVLTTSLLRTSSL